MEMAHLRHFQLKWLKTSKNRFPASRNLKKNCHFRTDTMIWLMALPNAEKQSNRTAEFHNKITTGCLFRKTAKPPPQNRPRSTVDTTFHRWSGTESFNLDGPSSSAAANWGRVWFVALSAVIVFALFFPLMFNSIRPEKSKKNALDSISCRAHSHPTSERPTY